MMRILISFLSVFTFCIVYKFASNLALRVKSKKIFDFYVAFVEEKDSSYKAIQKKAEVEFVIRKKSLFLLDF